MAAIHMHVAQDEFEVPMCKISNPILYCSLKDDDHYHEPTMYMELYQDTEPDICTLVANLLYDGNLKPTRAINLEILGNIIQTESLHSSSGTYRRYLSNYIGQPPVVAKDKGAVYLTSAQNTNLKLTFTISDWDI
eukprot:905385_1